MNVKIGDRWKDAVAEAVRSGRYASEEDVVNEGLRLVVEKERRRQELKASLEAAIVEGGDFSSDEVMAKVRRRLGEAALKPAAE